VEGEKEGEVSPMAMTAVNAISAMVAPVVLLSLGGLLTNGLLTVYSAINDRMREMTRERIEILTGPAREILDSARVPEMDRERLGEIRAQLPLLLRRHKLLRLSVLTIYAAITVLGLSTVVIAIAVGQHDQIAGRVALGLVVAGTIIMLLGIGVAVTSLCKSADAIAYAVDRTQSLGCLAIVGHATRLREPGRLDPPLPRHSNSTCRGKRHVTENDAPTD
jgi:hypothetical protein